MTKKPKKNMSPLYASAREFISVCEKSNAECSLFIDLTAPRKDDVDIEVPNTPIVKEFESKKTILKTFEKALKNSKSGDKVVFSVIGHGSPESSKSCIITGGGKGKICSEDLKKIIEKYKKPGVKVLISAEGCWTGTFHELASKEVCTYATSSKSKQSYLNNGNGFWQLIDYFRDDKEISLKKIRNQRMFFDPTFSQLRSSGGGFLSEVIRDKMCENVVSDHFSTSITRDKVKLWMNQLVYARKNWKELSCPINKESSEDLLKIFCREDSVLCQKLTELNNKIIQLEKSENAETNKKIKIQLRKDILIASRNICFLADKQTWLDWFISWLKWRPFQKSNKQSLKEAVNCENHFSI